MAGGSSAYAVLNATNDAADGSGQSSPVFVSGNTFYGFGGGGAVFTVYGPPGSQGSNVFLPITAAPAVDTSTPFLVSEPASAVLFAAGVLAALAWRAAQRRQPEWMAAMPPVKLR